MNILQDQINNGFSDFKGSKMEGTLRLSDSLLNQLLGEFLGISKQPKSAQTSGAIDASVFFNFVKSLTVKTEAGAVNVHIEGNI